ncbi:MAG: helix-turn-helix transcriptional regulator [Rhodobacteraceae bacterium]|nr:helix-turn-helix transcriptional regulator [Paracoccaceae bacterium]
MTKPQKEEKQASTIVHHGKRLRHARLLKGYTLKQLADIVKCSESMLSKLENSRLSPSLAMLGRISAAVDVPVPDLLIQDDGYSPVDGVTLFPSSRFEIQPGDDIIDVAFNRILPLDRSGLLQLNMLHVQPGAEQSRTLAHEGEEFIFVLEGALDVIIEDRQYRVAASSGIFFSSTMNHRYANNGDAVARAFWVNTPPTM